MIQKGPHNRMAKVTINDIAERAGVSKSAVSFAFNDPARLSSTTVDHILKVADELGYTRNPLARMLSTSRTNSIGLLLPQDLPRVFDNPYTLQFMRGIAQVCDREGLTLLLVPPLQGSMLKAIPYAAVDGFIVTGLDLDRGEVQVLRQRDVPFVLVDSELEAAASTVHVDDRGGARALLEYVLEHGHRDIALVPFESGTGGDIAAYRGTLARRMAGYADALASVEMTLDHPGVTIIETPCTREGGYDAFAALWRRERRPTAVIALSDIIAIGVLDAARERGVRVPDDVSVAGFDDQIEAAWVQPALTTVYQPIEAKGRLAAELLVGAIRGATAHRHDTLHTTLIVRQSVGPVPATDKEARRNKLERASLS